MKTIVNILTFLRIVLAVPIALMILLEKGYFITLVLFFIGSLTDYLDGYLSRKYSVESVIGAILDPVADKIFITFILIALSVNLSSPLIGFLGSIIIAREIWIAALRDYNARRNLSNLTSVIYISKVKTAIQMIAISLYLLALSINFIPIFLIADILLILTTLITLYTGYIYTAQSFNNDKK